MSTVFFILLVAGVLFASNKVRPDIVAMLTVVALMLTGVLTPREALAGFGDPVVILVACLLVVGESLTRTGVAQGIAKWLTRTAGDSKTRLLVLLMVAAGVLGAVMSSTAVVAILIPAVLGIGRKTGIPAPRLLMPLSYAALISGMLTLIATTPNLVVNAELDRAGYDSFNFFSFTPIGLSVLVVGIAYMVLMGRRLLPGDVEDIDQGAGYGMRDLLEQFGSIGRGVRLRIPPASPLVRQTLIDSEIGSRYHLRVVMLEREERLGGVTKASPSGDLMLRAGDVLVVGRNEEAVERLIEDTGVERLETTERDRVGWLRDVGVALVLIHPRSRLLGKSLRSSKFRGRYKLTVLGLRRKGKVERDPAGIKLESGDELLVLGPWDQIGRLQSLTHDFVVLTLPSELQDEAPARSKAPIALLILLGMVSLSAFEIVPVVLAVILAALAAVFTRTLTMEDAYRSIHWSSLVLIAGMLPAAAALEKTGGIDAIVNVLVSGLGNTGPYVMLTAIFFLTAGLGLFLSNTASAVLVAPVAIGAAQAMQVSPYAFVMTVAIAASAAFVTPFSTPVVTLVVSPGGYRFTDFVKVGLPLTVLLGVFAVPLTAWLYPI